MLISATLGALALIPGTIAARRLIQDEPANDPAWLAVTLAACAVLGPSAGAW